MRAASALANNRATYICSRASLVKFHAAHYHASNMRLVVLGRQSLAELTSMVQAKFSAVPNGMPSTTRTPQLPQALSNQRRTPKERQMRWPPPFARAQRARAMVWLPQKQRRSLTLMWALPPQRKLFKKKAPQFVAALLGDEGHGSIIAQLRTLQLAQVFSPCDIMCVCAYASTYGYVCVWIFRSARVRRPGSVLVTSMS